MPYTIWLYRFAARTQSLRRFLYLSSGLICFFMAWTTAAAQAQRCEPYPSPHQRIGYNFTRDGNVKLEEYAVERLGAGWYHDYTFHQIPAQPGGIRYHQMVRGAGRTTPAQIQQLLDTLGPVVDANPGTIWILGNEPDRYGQDELTPAQYARFYHDVYTFLKQRDPTSRIAIAGIVQPTPIRLRYLDMVLAAYQQSYGTTMPVEYWDVHNFILPENCDWGAGIPPGLEAYTSEGIACPVTLNDHGSLTIFKQQLRAFRQWMTARGYQDRPLIVSEYGILLSKYHGYDYPRVRNFMLSTFDFMLTTTDPATGYPQDGNLLVQEFAWFSLNYYEFNLQTYVGLNGNLFDHDSRQMMPLGLDYETYVKGVTKTAIDLTLNAVHATPAQVNVNTPVLLTATLANQGDASAQNVAVRFWQGNPFGAGSMLGTAPIIPTLAAQCTPTEATFSWTPTQAGVYTIFAEVQADNSALDRDSTNNYAYVTLTISDVLTATPTTMPTATPTALPTPMATPTPTPTTAQPAPSLTFTLAVAPAMPTIGDDLIYTLYYHNVGALALENLTFRLIIPGATEFNRSKSAAGWGCLQASAGNPCQFTLGQVASKESGTIAFALTLRGDATGTPPPITLTVQASNPSQSINLVRSAEVAVQGQQSYTTYLPLVQQ